MYISQKIHAVLVFFTAFALLSSSLGTTVVSAQITPGGTGVPGPGTGGTAPGGPGSDGPVGAVTRSNELERARNVVWDSVLDKSKDPIARTLDDVYIPLSGIVEIDGTDKLYVGISEDDYEDAKTIKTALEARFPGIPIHVEVSEGIQYDQVTPLSFTKAVSTPIPDNTSSQGTSSTITVPDDVYIDTVSVSLRINHTHRSDLVVDLVAPNGLVFSVFNGPAGPVDSSDNVVGAYTISGVTNQHAKGSWTLRVGDYRANDTGIFGTWTLNITPKASVPSTATPTDIFSDNFTAGFGKWTKTTGVRDIGWEATTHAERDTIDGYNLSNIIAQARECDTPCTITTKAPINLSTHSSKDITLSFDRWIDTSLDSGEYLKLEVSNDGGTTYRELDKWRPEDGDDDDKWYKESYVLTTADKAATNFKVRFSSLQSSAGEETAIDNISIKTPATRTTTTPASSTHACDGTSVTKSLPVAGGDRVVVRNLTSSTIFSSTHGNHCGTLTLGGVQTKDGRQGFIMSAHVARIGGTVENNALVGHGIRGSSATLPLGKVTIMPPMWRQDVTNDVIKENVINADAAFVEYPKTCTVDWRDDNTTYCFQYGYVNPAQVQSKKIRDRDGTLYSVVGSQSPTDNLAVKIAGAYGSSTISRTVQSENLVNGRLLFVSRSSGLHHYVYPTTGTQSTIGGDSGAPVFTVTDATKKEVKIVGVHVGKTHYSGKVVPVFSSWDDTTSALGLKSL